MLVWMDIDFCDMPVSQREEAPRLFGAGSVLYQRQRGEEDDWKDCVPHRHRCIAQTDHFALLNVGS